MSHNDQTVWYHGTYHDFEQFDLKFTGQRGMKSCAIWFTSSPQVASDYAMCGYSDKVFDDDAVKHRYIKMGGNVRQCLLTLSRPMVLDAGGALWTRVPFADQYGTPQIKTIAECSECARLVGHDSMIVENVVDVSTGGKKIASTVAAVFSHTLITSLYE